MQNSLSSEQARKMFPVEVQVTQEMLTNGKRFSMQECFGALALKSVFPDNRVFWYNCLGKLEAGTKLLNVRSVEPDNEEEDVYMMSIQSPRKVKFILQ